MLTANGTKKPILHVIGLPHTVVDKNLFSCCAFTMKIERFAKMMTSMNWIVYEYTNQGSKSLSSKHLEVLSLQELKELSLRTDVINDPYEVDISNIKLREAFTKKLHLLLNIYVNQGDIICHVFGPSKDLVDLFPLCTHVESGIGYPYQSYILNYRIFESSAWMHYHAGKAGILNGNNYHFVVPNYYDLDDWKTISLNPIPKTVLFFGRQLQCKGLSIVLDLADRMPDYHFVLVGQRYESHYDPKPNVEVRNPVLGDERDKFMSIFSCIILPTVFIEPFGGSGVEAQLCGVPVVSSNFGAFHETVEENKTGYRCNTIGDYIEGIKKCQTLNRLYIAQRARAMYSLETVGKQYNKAFSDIIDLSKEGYYSLYSNKDV